MKNDAPTLDDLCRKEQKDFVPGMRSFISHYTSPDQTRADSSWAVEL